MRKSIKKEILEFFLDIGITAWLLFIAGIMIIVIANWSEYKEEYILAMMGIYLFLMRLYQLSDRDKILKEIKKK